MSEADHIRAEIEARRERAAKELAEARAFLSGTEESFGVDCLVHEDGDHEVRV